MDEPWQLLEPLYICGQQQWQSIVVPIDLLRLCSSSVLHLQLAHLSKIVYLLACWLLIYSMETLFSAVDSELPMVQLDLHLQFYHRIVDPCLLLRPVHFVQLQSSLSYNAIRTKQTI